MVTGGCPLVDGCDSFPVDDVIGFGPVFEYDFVSVSWFDTGWVSHHPLFVPDSPSDMLTSLSLCPPLH